MNAHVARFLAVVALATVAFTRSADANAPAGRYTTSSGTVYDTKTKLTWQQAVAPGTYAWAGAKAYCAGLNLGGTGWRLPTIKELQTIESIDRYNSLSLDAGRLVLVIVAVGRLIVLRVGRRLRQRLRGQPQPRCSRFRPRSLCALRTGILTFDSLTLSSQFKIKRLLGDLS